MKKNITLVFMFIVVELFSQNTYKEFFFKSEDLGYIDEIFAADLDGDSDTDFLLNSFNGRKMYFAKMENLQEPFYSVISDSFDIRFTKLYDYNDDGKIDIIGSAPFANLAFWWENDGSGNFTKHRFVFDKYQAICFGDIDGDDIDEMILSHKDGIRIYSLDKGAVTLKKIVANDSWVGDPLSVSLFDNDNDGDLDILASYGLKGIRIYENNGSYSFNTILVKPEIYNMEKVIASDINNDGLMDILAFSPFYGSTVLLTNIGNNKYEKTTLKIGEGRDEYNDFGDFDNDGDIDILYVEKVNYSKSNIYIFNNDNGNFKKELITDKYQSTYGSIGDIDNDGDADIYLYSNKFYDKGLLIFQNITPPAKNSDVLSKKKNINIYPNLCKTFVSIKIKGDFSFNIFDSRGKLIEKGIGKDDKNIDCSTWRSGIYYVLIKNKSLKVSKKIIKIQ